MKTARSLFPLLGLLVTFVVPVVAFAQPAAVWDGEPSWWMKFVSPEGVLSILATIATFVGGFTWLKPSRKRQIATAVKDAYRMAANQAAITEGNDFFDKAAAGLKFADQVLLRANWRPLEPLEQEEVRLEFDKLHGAEVLQLKLAAAATSPK
jgi:hypothetical protein